MERKNTDAEGESLLFSVRRRVPWLLGLFLLGFVVSLSVGLFESVVKELPLIVAFQSLILGMAGNVGTQSLAVTVREIGEGKRICRLALVLKESGIALVSGLLIGSGSVLIVGGYLFFIGGYSAGVSFGTALCVGLALTLAMAVAGLTGALIPTAFERIGVDPAIASGPLITTVIDLVAVFGYYGLALLLLL